MNSWAVIEVDDNPLKALGIYSSYVPSTKRIRNNISKNSCAVEEVDIAPNESSGLFLPRENDDNSSSNDAFESIRFVKDNPLNNKLKDFTIDVYEMASLTILRDYQIAVGNEKNKLEILEERAYMNSIIDKFTNDVRDNIEYIVANDLYEKIDLPVDCNTIPTEHVDIGEDVSDDESTVAYSITSILNVIDNDNNLNDD